MSVGPPVARALALLAVALIVGSSILAGNPADCVDEDGDGYGAFGNPHCPNGPEPDCDDTNGSVYPGAPEVCDGFNNDCLHPDWPWLFSWEEDWIAYVDAYSVFAADVDGDDDLDVLVADHWDDEIVWWDNLDGDGSHWNNRPIPFYASGAVSVFAADIDGDGDVDALAASQDADEIVLYENTAGDGSTWEELVLSESAENAEAVFAADLDGDDDVDVLSASSDDDTIAWYENTAGDGSAWTERAISTNVIKARAVFAADVDGDDDLDVVSGAYSYGGEPFAWHENTAGDGSSWLEHKIAFSSNYVISLFVADVDGDDDLDIVSHNQDVLWLENTNGDGSQWTPHLVPGSAITIMSVFAVDMDGDDDVDILSASQTDDQIALFENVSGDGSQWVQRVISTSADGARSVIAANLDGDDDMDIVSGSFVGNELAWYMDVPFDGDHDGDGLPFCGVDCDDENANCTYDCTTDVDGDGLPDCADSCLDADGDEHGDPGGAGDECIAPDCDDANPECTTDCTDMDGDGFCVTTDCDDDRPHCDVNCTDADQDGYCVNNDCDDGDPICSTDCSDLDEDGLCGTADCDDFNPNCVFDCTDTDGDLYCADHDCDDADPNNWGSCAFCLDADGDTYFVGCDAYVTINGPDCDDGHPYCTSVCTDADQDGYCVGVDCDDTTGSCVTDCTDADADGLALCAGDCDDLNPGCTTDCTDDDGDGHCVTHDCDDSNSSVYPGAPELCDEVNNDCDHPGWPHSLEWLVQEVDGYAQGAQSVFASDVDGDGDLDVLVASHSDDTIAWHENTSGYGTGWIEHVISTSANGVRAVVGVDIDGDQDVDVLSVSQYDDRVEWHENTAGDGSAWTTRLVDTLVGGGSSVFAADIDGDDDLDVLAASWSDARIAWYENLIGTGAYWAVREISTSAMGARAVFAADVDGDDDVDVLSASWDDDKIAWYENAAGDGSVWTERVISTAADGAGAVFAIDVDGDQDVDVLSASYLDDTIAWYENTAGDGSAWSTGEVSTSAIGAYAVHAADMDGDDDVDVLSASRHDDKVAWYENLAGDGSGWAEWEISTSLDQASSVSGADIDGDGDPDVLGASYGDDAVLLYRQDDIESDDDGDGLGECDGDCDDVNPTVYPGAPEVNDGIDNQCPGFEGHGLIDEIEGESGFHDPDSTAEYSWPGQPGATLYEVARFADPGSPLSCTLIPTAETFVLDPEGPPPGATFYYLVRALAPHTGSWGQDSSGIERTNVCP